MNLKTFLEKESGSRFKALNEVISELDATFAKKMADMEANWRVWT